MVESTSADVASTFFTLRAVDEEQTLVRNTVDLRRRALDLVSARQRSGSATDLDVARAETELASTEAESAALANRRAALQDALAVFECARESVQDAGDHAILIGRVLRFARNDGAGAPLVYFQGRYGALAQGAPPDGIEGRRITDSD